LQVAIKPSTVVTSAANISRSVITECSITYDNTEKKSGLISGAVQVCLQLVRLVLKHFYGRFPVHYEVLWREQKSDIWLSASCCERNELIGRKEKNTLESHLSIFKDMVQKGV
jgi:hypothetical protein